MTQPSDRATAAATAGAGLVLLTLCSGQFLMALDSSVMNVSIATVASDVGTTVTGVQTAITLYTLVMASLMITGGRVGELMGRKRAFALGCVIYGCGSLTTSLAPNLTVLILGWSFLEGIGAVLIMPAIVALVASNFAPRERPRAYGLVASAAAMAVAVGPLIGGLVTTYASWRYVFAGEVVIVAVILVLSRRIAEAEPEERSHIDYVGTLLSASGLALVVLGVLQSGSWGWVLPQEGAPDVLGLSPVVWMLIGGGVLLRIFVGWENHRIAQGRDPLLDPGLLKNLQLRSGLMAFFFQYVLQAGLFFIVPLFLSVALGLSAVATGARLLPLSITLLLAAAGIPKVFPHTSPRRIVNFGLVSMLVGLVVLVGAIEAGAGPEIVTLPLLLAGLGVGSLASQLGSVTVSSVPDEQSSQVGGVQNTVMNLGASIGTALAGAVLISSLTAAFFTGIADDPNVPDAVSAQAEVQLSAGIPFVSDAQLHTALDDAGVPPATADAIAEDNATARLKALRASLAVLAMINVVALFFVRRIPTVQPGDAADTDDDAPDAEASTA